MLNKINCKSLIIVAQESECKFMNSSRHFYYWLITPLFVDNFSRIKKFFYLHIFDSKLNSESMSHRGDIENEVSGCCSKKVQTNFKSKKTRKEHQI